MERRCHQESIIRAFGEVRKDYVFDDCRYNWNQQIHSKKYHFKICMKEEYCGKITRRSKLKVNSELRDCSWCHTRNNNWTLPTGSYAMVLISGPQEVSEELEEDRGHTQVFGQWGRNLMVTIHLTPEWWPINYSFVCMLVSPLCLISMYKTQKNFEVKVRQRGLINLQTKEWFLCHHFGIRCIALLPTNDLVFDTVVMGGWGKA